MTPESLSLIVGIVGGVVTVVAFFAAVVFYHQGTRLNRATERILARIDAKVGVIQDEYSRIIDRTLSLAEDGSGALAATLTDRLAAVTDSLKSAIGETIRTTDHPAATPEKTPTSADLERRIAAIIDSKMGAARQETINVLEISGYRAAYDGIVRLVLRSLRHGPILTRAVQRYMHSHCFNLLLADLGVLLQRLEAEGLATRRPDLDAKVRERGGNGADSFWDLTAAGRAVPGVEDSPDP